MGKGTKRVHDKSLVSDKGGKRFEEIKNAGGLLGRTRASRQS